jgi:hypothetical protein
MMPGAADFAPDHQPIRERRVVMTAMRIDGEKLRAGAHQQDVLIANMTEQEFAGKVNLRNALSEIRTRGRRMLFCHVNFSQKTAAGALNAMSDRNAQASLRVHCEGSRACRGGKLDASK